MGLAGRKVKQRIGHDPRNLTWSDDSSKFGLKYLQSLGWSTGSGLGATGEGRVSNLKIHQKLDLMGIGANRRGGLDDVAWKGGREFEGLLARLNQGNPHDSQAASEEQDDEDEIDVAEEASVKLEATEECEDGDSCEEKERKKKESKEKRKRSEVEDGDEEVDAKEAKRRRKEKKARKEKEKQQKAERKAEKKLKKVQKEGEASESGSRSVVVVESTTTLDEVMDVEMKAKVVGGPVYRAHRARHLAAKRLAAGSSKSMNEILGISASAAVDESFSFTPPSGTPSGTQTPTVNPTSNSVKLEDNEDSHRSTTLGLGTIGFNFGGGLGFRKEKEEPAQEQNTDNDNLLRKSGVSMADYFAAKMKQKEGKEEVATSTSTVKIVVVEEEEERGKRKKSKDKNKKELKG